MAIQEIFEALETRKFQPGQVKFSTSQWADPHIQKILNAVAKAEGVSPSDIVKEINDKLAQFAPAAQKAPVLYQTIKDNIIENELFNKLADSTADIDTGAPKFRERTFFKLVRSIAVEHDEFWPLRSYIDGRALQPKFEFVTLPMNDQSGGVTTAAATPNGTFIFNTLFMQKLLDYAALKDIHPKGKKYEKNGGDIPDGYAYIEFLILHEFMHYTNDDFHYQKVIPNANPKIINWVGDFRSNYLLVKSGYEQLPLGLFNDGINYDRQPTYDAMYDLVKSEFEALQDPQMQNMMQQILDSLGDDHEPGQKEGAEEGDGGMKPEDIDKAGQKTSGQMQEGEDLSPDEAKEKEAAKANAPGNGPGGPDGGRGRNGAGKLDYSKIKPAFNWQTIVKRFLAKATMKTEETYSKPARRSVSSMDIARQVGAAAIKPAEKPLDFAEARLGFVIDSSGSMNNVIGKVMSNATQLLTQPAFKHLECLVIKFSSSHEVFRVNFAGNKAAKVPNTDTKPKNYPLTVADVFGVHFGAGTNFGAAIKDDLISAAKKKWNLIFFLDNDILAKGNFENFMDIIRAAPANVFVIFDGERTYNQFRQKAGTSTPNITYFT